jgi:HK97 family phage major capsid protein
VEQSGFIVNGAMGAVSMMGKLRGLRTTDGQFIFMNDMRSPNDYRLAGVPLTFPNNGAFNPTNALLVVGDFSQAVYAVRKDITFKVATEASIHSNTGDLQYNLFQDDMVALRVTMRMGWQLPNPVTLVKGSSGLPFAVLVP